MASEETKASRRVSAWFNLLHPFLGGWLSWSLGDLSSSNQMAMNHDLAEIGTDRNLGKERPSLDGKRRELSGGPCISVSSLASFPVTGTAKGCWCKTCH